MMLRLIFFPSFSLSVFFFFKTQTSSSEICSRISQTCTCLQSELCPVAPSHRVAPSFLLGSSASPHMPAGQCVCVCTRVCMWYGERKRALIMRLFISAIVFPRNGGRRAWLRFQPTPADVQTHKRERGNKK